MWSSFRRRKSDVLDMPVWLVSLMERKTRREMEAEELTRHDLLGDLLLSLLKDE